MDLIPFLGKPDEFGSPLDLDAGRLELLAQQPLMVVLREAEGEGIGAQAFAEVAEFDLRDLLVALPEVGGPHLDPATNHVFRETELAIEFQGARLDDHGAGGLAGAGVLLDDARLDAATGEKQGQRQTRGPAPTISTCASFIGFSPVALAGLAHVALKVQRTIA